MDLGDWSKRGPFLLIMVILIFSLTGCGNFFGSDDYVISGIVVDEEGEGIPGFTLLLKGDTTGTIVTDKEGRFSEVVEGKVRVEASKEGFVFDPSTFDVETAKDDLRFERIVESVVSDPEATVVVKGIEFGEVLVYQLQIMELKGLPEASGFLLLAEGQVRGALKDFGEASHAVSIEDRVELVILSEDNGVMARAEVMFGEYEETLLLEEVESDRIIEISSPSLDPRPQVVDEYLAEGVIRFDDYSGEEGEFVEDIILLELRDQDGITDIPESYFLMDNLDPDVVSAIAVEVDFAYDHIETFNLLFNQKYDEVGRELGDLGLYVHINDTLTDAKTGEEETQEEKERIENRIMEIFDEDHPEGILRPRADVLVSVMEYDGTEMKLYEVNVESVSDTIVGANAFTLRHPTETPKSFGETMETNTTEGEITLYILGDVEDEFAGGEGTEEEPYLVGTPAHLDNVRNYLGDGDVHFKMVADINLAGYPSFEPIGSFEGEEENTLNFKGTFDGNDFVISNLTIDRPLYNHVGLFGYIGDGAKLEDISIEGIDVRGNKYVGGLVGRSDGGEISNCRVESGEVRGENDFVGGLVGVNWEGSEIDGCYTDVTVSGEGNYVGGLVGVNSGNSTIEDSEAAGDVLCKDYVGGLVGLNDDDSEIKSSIATGDVSGEGKNIGGLVGMNNDSAIENCTATGDVSGEGQNVGGLVGRNDGGGTIDGSSASGDVTGDEQFVGGLVGLNWEGTIEESEATGDVLGLNNVGGLVGMNWDKGEIKESSATGSATATGGSRMGYLVGRNDGDVEGCEITVPEGEELWLSGNGTYEGGLIAGDGKLILGRNIVLDGVDLSIAVVELEIEEHLGEVVDSTVGTIIISDDIDLEETPTLVVGRGLTIDFQGYTLTGDVTFNHGNPESSTLEGTADPSIDGDLTVNTPNASFTNNVEVSGDVNIVDVDSESWTENAHGNTLLISDGDGATITINGDPKEITVEGSGDAIIITVAEGATVPLIEVDGSATRVMINNSGTIELLDNDAVDTILTGNEPDNTEGMELPLIVEDGAVTVETSSHLIVTAGNEAVETIIFGNDITLEDDLDVNREVTIDGNSFTLSGGHTVTVTADAGAGAVLIKDLTFDNTIDTVEVETGATNVTLDEVTFGTHTLTLGDDVTLEDVDVTDATINGAGTSVLVGNITNDADSFVGVAVDTSGVTTLTSDLDNATAGFAAFGTAAIDITDNNVDDNLVINLDVDGSNDPIEDWANAVTSITLDSSAGGSYTITEGFDFNASFDEITINAGEFTVAADDYELTIEATNYADVVSDAFDLELEAGAFDAGESTVAVDETERTADEDVNVTVTPKDQYGNDLGSGETVVVLLDGSDSDVDDTITVTDETDGTYTATVNVSDVEAANVISATVDGEAITDTQIITVTHGAAAKLAVETEPELADTAGGDEFDPQPVVHILDQYDNHVTDADDVVTATTGGETSGEWNIVEDGSQTETAASGIASFSGLAANNDSQDTDAVGAYITFEADGLDPVDSATFTVVQED